MSGNGIGRNFMEASEGSSQVAPPAQLRLSADDPFDWEAYISNYQGRARIQRLLYLASHSPTLRRPCSEEAVTLITQTTKDVQLYHNAIYFRNTRPGPNAPSLPQDERFPIDTEWCENIERSNRSESEKLDLELRNYMNNLIKESIRMAHRDLGDHLRAMGNLQDALKFYIKTRDYCTTSEDVVEMCLNVIETSLELQQYSNISDYVSKAEGLLSSYNPAAAATSSAKKSGSGSVVPPSKGGTTSGADAIGALFRAGGSAANQAATFSSLSAQLSAPQSSSEREAEAQGKKQVANVAAKLSVAQGIAELGVGHYYSAAQCFLRENNAATDAYSNMASRADIALYAILCCLATFERKDLRVRVIERPNLGAFLEHEAHTRELVDAFYACQYKKTLQILDKWQSRYLLDVHLAPHYYSLRKAITERAILQFAQPFDFVRLDKLAGAIWTEAETARAADELLALIQAGRLDARIDWINKVLHLGKIEARQNLYETALENGRTRTATAKHLIFRMNVVQNDLVVKTSNESMET